MFLVSPNDAAISAASKRALRNAKNADPTTPEQQFLDSHQEYLQLKAQVGTYTRSENNKLAQARKNGEIRSLSPSITPYEKLDIRKQALQYVLDIRSKSSSTGFTGFTKPTTIPSVPPSVPDVVNVLFCLHLDIELSSDGQSLLAVDWKSDVYFSIPLNSGWEHTYYPFTLEELVDNAKIEVGDLGRTALFTIDDLIRDPGSPCAYRYSIVNPRLLRILGKAEVLSGDNLDYIYSCIVKAKQTLEVLDE